MKIGIITHYYKSKNYGGILQAYALVKVLRNMGYDAEQICYQVDWRSSLSEACITPSDLSASKKTVQPMNKSFGARIISNIKQLIYSGTKGKYIERKYSSIEKELLVPRRGLFAKFCDGIPHSDMAFSANTLFICNEIYDVFITGSDQVWNFAWHDPGCFLEFADDNKKKIAYAASAGSSTFDSVQQKYLARILPKYNAISVREADLVGVYYSIAGVNSTNVLDPVLLLNSNDWDNIATDRMINDTYLFCFFYNPTEQVYNLAKEYAKKFSLKIAVIPYALGQKSLSLDDDFGDYRIGLASPENFISLVKYADCIFTDSFHAMVYALIYRKQAFAFERSGGTGMSSRLITLTELFECSDHFCCKDNQMTMDYIESREPIDYSREFLKFKELKNESLNFLKESLSM